MLEFQLWYKPELTLMTSLGDVNLSLCAFSTFWVFEVCNNIRSGVTGFRLVEFFLSPKTESNFWKILTISLDGDPWSWGLRWTLMHLSTAKQPLSSAFVLEEKEVELSRFCFWFRIPLYVALNSSCVAKLSIFDLLAEEFCLRDPRGNSRWISEVVAEKSSGCCDSYQMCIGARWSLRTFPSFQLSPETQLLFRPIWERAGTRTVWSSPSLVSGSTSPSSMRNCQLDRKRGFEDLAKTTCATCVVSGGFGRERDILVEYYNAL